MADATSAVKTKTCKFFESKKGCKFGNECQFLHPEKLSNESGSILTEVDKLHEDQKQPDTSANEISSTSNSTAKPCRFFKSKRGCAFGKKCRFLHPDLKIPNESETISKVNDHLHDGDQKEAVLSSNNETQGEEKLEKGIDEQKESSYRQGIICKFFQRKRGCLRGNKCPFAHVISADGAINLKPHARKGSKKAGNISSKQKPHQNKEASKPINQITKQPIESCNTQTENHNKELERQETVQVPPPPDKDASVAKDTGMSVTEHNPGKHKQLRSIEIQQLKTRFRGSYYEIKENESYKIKFKPTDPDWVSRYTVTLPV